MNRIVHFEFGAADPDRAAKFYGSAFGWNIQKWAGPMDYWMVNTGEDGPGINGGILRFPDGTPRTINTIEVPSIEDALEKVTAAGGKVVVEKMPIPGVGYQAYCTDTEGLIFGLHVNDPTVK